MRAAVIVAGLAALTACAGGMGGQSSAVAAQSSSGPAAVLPEQPPAGGFSMTLDVSLNLGNASIATPGAQAATAEALRAAGFSSGQERVWTKGAEHVTDLVLQLDTEIDTAAFVQFEAKQIAASRAATTSAFNAIPSGLAFSLYGFTRQGSQQTFCQGVWFPAGTRVFELTDCAGAPRYPDFVGGLARQQYARASSS